jgi:hypothetical protein
MQHGLGSLPRDVRGAGQGQAQLGFGKGRVGGQRLARTGGPKADPFVQPASSGVLVSHPQDHFAGSAVSRPAHDLADQGTGDSPSPVARVDPHRHKMHTSRNVELSEDCGQADVNATLRAMKFADAGPPWARCRQTSTGNATSAARVLAKASGASVNARSRSCRSASQSVACACRASMPAASPAPEHLVDGGAVAHPIDTNLPSCSR